MDSEILAAANAHARRKRILPKKRLCNCGQKTTSGTLDDGFFRILNTTLDSTTPTLPTATPDVRFFDLHGEHVVFDANSLCLAQVGEKMVEKLKTFDMPRNPQSPPFRGLLFSRNKPQFRLAPATSVRRVVLNVTHACNLACHYCFAGGHHDEPTMPRGAAMRGVALLDPRAPVDVAFFGGEPLLAWDLVKGVMEEASELARKRGVRAKFHITTNGTLLDEEKLLFLKDRPCTLLVSLDGPKEIHDAARPFRQKQCSGGTRSVASESSFEAVMQSLRTAKAVGLSNRIMARATFDANNARLVERLEFFANLQEQGLIRGYSVEPAVLGEGCARRGDESFDRVALASEYHAAAVWFADRVRRKRPVGFFHFRKLLERIVLAKHAGSECGAGKGYVTVAPDGTIHACHREGTPVGHVAYGIDEELRAPWCDNRLYTKRLGEGGCMRCWARHLCGGGCRQARLELGGDLNAPVPGRCFIQRTLLRECFWILTQLRKDEVERVVKS